jgi:hypothetical protein
VTRWIRIRSGARATVGAAVAAGVVATAVGSVTFYLARLMLSREAMDRDAHGKGVPEEHGKGGGA